MNFPLSAPSPFLHLGSFSGIEEKRNSQEPGKLIFHRVKYQLLCFVLILRKLIHIPGELVFEHEELIIPHVHS